MDNSPATYQWGYHRGEEHWIVFVSVVDDVPLGCGKVNDGKIVIRVSHKLIVPRFGMF